VQNAALEAMRAKDKQERSEVESLRAHMKGKHFTYDHSGNVVLLTAIDPHHLPKPMSTPAFRPVTPGNEESVVKRRAKGEKGVTKQLCVLLTTLLGLRASCFSDAPRELVRRKALFYSSL
jgi:hypothetical protein